ncbi:hypothetical protein BC628DRAFT_1362777 [Trametes gibbosa]|nr:hypothetical protein BC628DRAFT_1362777 [Trametes gibbosa]
MAWSAVLGSHVVRNICVCIHHETPPFMSPDSAFTIRHPQPRKVPPLQHRIPQRIQFTPNSGLRLLYLPPAVQL